MIISKWLGLVTTFLFLGRADALEATAKGSVQVLGSQANARVNILESNGKIAHKLCKGPLADPLFKLTGMQVVVTGTTKFPKARSKKCIEVQSIKFEKSNSGNPVMVGTIERTGEKFFLLKDSNTKVELSNKPNGIETQVDKKVILILPKEKIFPQDENRVLVESYIEYP